MKVSTGKQIIRVNELLHVLMIIVSLLLVIDISVDIFNKIPYQTQPTYLRFQLWVCIFFLSELVFEFTLSKRKLHFFLNHFFFVIISIPYLNIINHFKIPLSEEVIYFARFIPLIRGGYALFIVANWFCKSRASSLLVTYLSILFVSVYFSSLMFWYFEQGVNPLVNSYKDAIWWAAMTVTTVGSNIYAVSTVGQILSVVLAALGMMMFPIFTVYITSIIQTKKKNVSVE